MIPLSDTDRQALEDLTHRGQHKARVLTRARILLLADQGQYLRAIARLLEVSPTTVYRTLARYEEGGLPRVLTDRPPTPHARALDAEGEAVLVALACSEVPEGYGHWTLRLLRDRLIALEVVEGISAATVHAVLKKTPSSPGE